MFFLGTTIGFPLFSRSSIALSFKILKCIDQVLFVLVFSLGKFFSPIEGSVPRLIFFVEPARFVCQRHSEATEELSLTGAVFIQSYRPGSSGKSAVFSRLPPKRYSQSRDDLYSFSPLSSGGSLLPERKSSLIPLMSSFPARTRSCAAEGFRVFQIQPPSRFPLARRSLLLLFSPFCNILAPSRRDRFGPPVHIRGRVRHRRFFFPFIEARRPATYGPD